MSDGAEYLGKKASDIFRQVYGGIFPEQAKTIFSDKVVTQQDIEEVLKAGLAFPHGLLYVWEQEYQSALNEIQWSEDGP